MTASLQLRFFKDSVYGTLALLVFSLLGRPERYLLAVHSLSLPCLLLCQLFGSQEHWAGRAAALACAYSSVLAALADFAAVCALSCSVSSCCPPGKRRPSFSLGMDVCAPGQGWDSQPVALAAIVTLCVGVAQSGLRALACGEGDSRPHLATFAYSALRAYQLAWLLQGGNLTFGLLGAGAAGDAGLAAASTFLDALTWARALCMCCAALELAALAVAASGLVVPSQEQAVHLSAQCGSVLLSARLAWGAWFGEHSRKGHKPRAEVGAKAETRAARRERCMVL